MALPSFLQNKKVLIGILVVVVLGGAGVFAFLFLGGDNAEEPAPVVTKVAITPPPKPEEKPAEGAPAEAAKPGEAKPAAAPGTPAPAAKPAETKPAAKPTETKPIAKPVETKSAAKPADTKPAAKPAETKSVTKAEEKKPAAKKTISKRWIVNTASFRTKEEATSVKKKLSKDGYRCYITEFKKDDINWFRLRVGFYATEADARKAADKIAKKHGLTGAWVTKPPSAEIAKYSK